MKSNLNLRIIILITFGILFIFSPIINNSVNFTTRNNYKIPENSDEINIDKEDLKISGISERIHIDNNWTDAKAAGICTGSGTNSDPYVIEDLVIDSEGLGNGILIRNSDVFFKIQNCTIYNSGEVDTEYEGIKLDRASNGIIIENNCSNNNAEGIYLTHHANNNTISNNTANYNPRGIVISGSDNNTVLGNTLNYNQYGIALWVSDYNTISENNASNNIHGIKIDQSSNINVSGNTANYNDYYGISIEYCENNSISGNTANYNKEYGISIEGSNYNNVSRNNVSYNTYGINFKGSSYNNVSRNNVNYNDENGIAISYCTNLTISENSANYNTEGMDLYDSYNNTVLGNMANNNEYGISLYDCIDNFVSGNTANYNTGGIALGASRNNIILENIMEECGLVIFSWSQEILINNIDTSNLVNGKPLYYYSNEKNLGTSNFTNAEQVILVNCTDSLFSNLNVSHGSIGISLICSHSNTISGNTANYNKVYGIFLDWSNNNIISGNTLIGNHKCWEDLDGENNTFENNDCGYIRPSILGYDLFLLIGLICLASEIIMKKLRPK